MNRFTNSFLSALFAALFIIPQVSLAEDVLAVALVVNNTNPTDELTFKEVKKWFKQERKYWNSGEKIYLVMLESSRPERALILRGVYEMTGKELKTMWLGMMFRGDISSFPKTFNSNEAVLRFVSQVPNAIGFIDAAAADNRVKILRIDGKHPGDPGYPLSD